MGKKRWERGQAEWGIFYLETRYSIIMLENSINNAASASSPTADSPKQPFTTLKETKKGGAKAPP